MLLDWFTVIAQIVNFLILIWLLQRFLYQPVLAAMAKREKSISDSQTAAEAALLEAAAVKAEFEAKQRELENEKNAFLSAAADQAAAEHATLLNAARLQVEERKVEWQRTLESEKTLFLQNLQQELQTEFFAFARQALRDLSDSELEERIVMRFLQELAQLPETEKTRFFSAAKETSVQPCLRSAFPLTPELSQSIGATLQEALPPGCALRFEVSPQLIAGIELVVGGEKLSWTLENQLRLLSEKIEQTLKGAEKNE